MKRVGRPEQKPFIIRRDGTLVDRDSASRIGTVYRHRLLGWVAVSDFGEFRGHGCGQTGAAQRAWDDWHQRCTAVPHGPETSAGAVNDDSER